MADQHETDDPRLGEVVSFPSARRARPDGDDSPRLRDVLGAVVRDERLGQGRTLAELAEDAAVSLPYLSEIERGRKEVSSDLLDAVVRSLGLDLAEVLERAIDRLRVRSQGHGPHAQLRAA